MTSKDTRHKQGVSNHQEAFQCGNGDVGGEESDGGSVADTMGTAAAGHSHQHNVVPLRSKASVPQKDIDLALVIRAQAGDYQAFDVLVKKYQHRLIALAQRFVGDADEAMDVVQDSFIKVYKALGRFRGESAFYTWIYRITVNTAKNFLASRSRRPQSADVELDELESTQVGHGLHEVATPEAEAYRDQLEKIVMSAIDELSPDLRTALVLREFEGLSYEDISVIMECPIGTVRSRIFRARDAVDACIKKESEEPTPT